jgi:putative ABC transport system permease protein
VGVTLLSALAPAVRATRVPPVAALQEGAALPSTRFTRLSTAIATAILALGAGSLAYGIFADGGANGRLLFMGLGALLLFVAIAMLAKFVVRPASRVIGWPLERLAPTSGRLARENAGRNPSRTAATAAALMIGLAMVVFVAVFAQAMKGSFGDAIRTATRADLVAQDRSAFLTVPQKTVRGLEGLPGVEAASGAAFAQLKVEGTGVMTTYGVDPSTFAEVWGNDWRRGGSDALFARLDERGVLLEDGSPVAAKVDTGDTITVTSQAGKTTRLTVLGFYRDQMAFTGMMTSLDTFTKLGVPTASGLTMVRTDGSAGVQDAVQAALADFPTQEVMTRDQYLDEINKMVDQMLTMFYGLLAMSVLISIFGIVNTLVLSVHERTREIGMLRAIGATRRQLRQMVRYESVITAVIGAVLGTLVGIGMGYVIVTQMGGDGLVFSLPWLQLGVFLVLAVVVGVVAAVLPARRASRTHILEAIQYE